MTGISVLWKLLSLTCFGDRLKVIALKVVTLSVTFGGVKGVKVYIAADIIKNDLPLQRSYKSRKTAER